MGTDDFRFLDATHEQQRKAVAQALGCDPNAPDGWPRTIIDGLVELRKTEGAKAYYEKVGYLLSLC